MVTTSLPASPAPFDASPQVVFIVLLQPVIDLQPGPFWGDEPVTVRNLNKQLRIPFFLDNQQT